MQGEGGQSPGATAVRVLARPSPVTTDYPGAQSAEGARGRSCPARVGVARQAWGAPECGSVLGLISLR